MRILLAAASIAVLAAPAAAQVSYSTVRTWSGATYRGLQGTDSSHYSSIADQPQCLTEKATGKLVCHSYDEWKSIARRIEKRTAPAN